MCHDRGYLITQLELDQTLDEFKAQFGNRPSENQPMRSQLSFKVQHSTDPSNWMFVFFVDEVKFGVKNIQSYCAKMISENANHAILVLQQALTHTAAKEANSNSNSELSLEYFVENELMINVTEHFLQPQFFLVNDELKAQILEKYNVKEQQLPKIQKTDPIARYYGLKKGELIRILRKSETAGISEVFRVCI